MPWNNQGGGGPWKPGGQGPWGQGGGPNGAGPQAPDLEELLKQARERMSRLMPGGGFTGIGVLALALAGVIVWGLTGFYTVAANEVGLNMIFGAYTGKTQAGLNYNWPYPIGSVRKLPVTDSNYIDVGSIQAFRGASTQPVPEESLMLTGDENIADLKFRVNWQIDPAHPEDFAFSLASPRETVKAVAESAMREIVGRGQIQSILNAGRKVIEPQAQELIQKVLNEYKAGILILQVQLLAVDPPPEVIAAFKDVTAAQQDLQGLIYDAQNYANGILQEAQGAAAAITQTSEGFREQTVREAKGQVARFNQVYEQYKKAPDVTRERLYLETMERVLGGAQKIIVDTPGANAPVPYLPLDGLSAKGSTP